MLFALPLLLLLAPGPAPEPAPAPLVDAGATRNPARAWLDQHKLAFDADTFVTMAAAGTPECVEHYLDAGMAAGTRNTQGLPALVSCLASWTELSRPEVAPYREKLVGLRFEVLRMLLARGAEARAAGPDGVTALHLAARYPPFRPMIAPLAAAGADLEAREPAQGLTPLLLAVHMRNLEGAMELIKAGTGVDNPSTGGLRPLVGAIRQNDLRMVQILLGCGADPGRRGQETGSCLHLAAEVGSLKIIQVLLDKGADRSWKDAAQATPLQAARARHRNPDILALLDPDAARPGA